MRAAYGPRLDPVRLRSGVPGRASTLCDFGRECLALAPVRLRSGGCSCATSVGVLLLCDFGRGAL
eukprot:2743037-Alexandrium_andersonii.AAC.1